MANIQAPADHRRTTDHQRLIDELRCYPEVKFSGFWKAVRSLPDAAYTQSLMRNDPEWLRDHKFVPDAWAINAEEREITLFEIVITNDVTPHKMSNINNFAWMVDQDEYSVGLVRCDLGGRVIYDCLAMAIIAVIDRADGIEDTLKSWRRLTVDHCQQRLAPVPTAENERLDEGAGA